jgi:ATP-binding cassette subfamily C (CFTR/MRP) protein 1
LQAEDLWKLDPSRECHDLADRFITAVEKRLAEDKIWNERLRSGDYKPAFLRKRIWWPFKAFFGFGQKDGSAKAGLFLALNDVFGRRFWLAGCIKVLSDGITTTTPLVTKALILFGTEAYYTRRGVPGYSEPELGRGVGLALGLFFMIVSGSLLLHQFFSRSTEVGVLARATLIAAIYRNALQLSGKARAQIPSSRLIAFVSTDVSRIDFAAGFAHLAWTSMIQFVIVLIILLVNLGPSSLVGIALCASRRFLAPQLILETQHADHDPVPDDGYEVHVQASEEDGGVDGQADQVDSRIAGRRQGHQALLLGGALPGQA